MNLAVTENLEIALGNSAPVRLTPTEAFNLAELLVRGGIRHAMLDESAKILFEKGVSPAIESDRSSESFNRAVHNG